MELPKLEPMTVLQIMARTFKLYGKHFLRFFSIFAVLHIPMATFRMTYVFHKAAEKVAETQDKLGLWESFVLDLSMLTLLGFLATAVGFVSAAAIFTSVSGHYLGKDIGFGQAYRLAWTKIKTILMLSLIWTVCITIAPSALRLGGSIISSEHDSGSVSTGPTFMTAVHITLFVVILIVTLWFAVAMQCVMAEGLSAWQSMKRSKALVKGNMWRVVGLWMMLGLISLVFMLIAGWGEDLFLKTMMLESVPNVIVLMQIRATLIYTLLGPLVLVAMSLLYYDLRARKEDFPQDDAGEYLGQIETDPPDYNLVG